MFSVLQDIQLEISFKVATQMQTDSWGVIQQLCGALPVCQHRQQPAIIPESRLVFAEIARLDFCK